MHATDVPDFAEYAGYSAAADGGDVATKPDVGDAVTENGLSDNGGGGPDDGAQQQEHRRRRRRRCRRRANFSNVKSAVRSVFEPSTNRLSMKIYGSEKAVLRERLRQRSAGYWVIHPCSKFRFYWDLCMLLLLVANLIILPVGIAFFNNDFDIRWIIFNCLSDVIFLVDIVVNFRTGILQTDNSEQVVLEPRLIAWNYLRSWFFLDLISSLPLDYLFLFLFNQEVGEGIQFLHAGRALRILRLAKLLSLVRLLRLSRLMRYVNQWEEVYISNGSSSQQGYAGKHSSSGKFLNMASVFMRIFNLICMMLLIGHWSGCLQFLIPSLQGFPANSWVAINELQEAHWAEQYSWSLFKAMSHILCIGYGRFPPQSLSDMWLTMLSMVSGATCYALFLGHATNLIQSLDSSRRQYREKVKQVEEFMSYRRLPLDMRKRITEYFEHRYQGRFFDEKWILNEISDQLRVEVRNYTCQKLVANLPILRNADINLLTEMIDCLEFEMFQPGDMIVHEGTPATKMYFIQEGVVEVLVAGGQEVVATLDDGSFFGETCLWSPGSRRPVGARAETYCNLFSLSAAAFGRVADRHPKFKDYVAAVRDERAERMAVIEQRTDARDTKPLS